MAAYLDHACGGDAQYGSGWNRCCGPTGRPASSWAAPHGSRAPWRPPETPRPPISEGPGSQIGPYKLLERLGEGAFGVVYMAEQREPVRRKVALKILKPGMDTKHVIARFEAEEQALALMDHPNIAGSSMRAPPNQAAPTSSWNWSRAGRSPNTATPRS